MELGPANGRLETPKFFWDEDNIAALQDNVGPPAPLDLFHIHRNSDFGAVPHGAKDIHSALLGEFGKPTVLQDGRVGGELFTGSE